MTTRSRRYGIAVAAFAGASAWPIPCQPVPVCAAAAAASVAAPAAKAAFTEIRIAFDSPAVQDRNAIIASRKFATEQRLPHGPRRA